MESGREEGEDRGRERGGCVNKLYSNSWKRKLVMQNLNTALTLIMTLPSS